MTPNDFLLYYAIASFLITGVILYFLTKKETDAEVIWIFGGIFLMLLLLTPAAISVSLLSETKCSFAKVVEVGGCSRSGTCAVLVEGGIKSYATMPVTGELVSYACEKVWK